MVVLVVQEVRGIDLPHRVAFIVGTVPAADLCEATQLFKRFFSMVRLRVSRVNGEVVRQHCNRTLEGILELSGGRKVKDTRLKSRDESIGSEVPPECLVGVLYEPA